MAKIQNPVPNDVRFIVFSVTALNFLSSAPSYEWFKVV